MVLHFPLHCIAFSLAHKSSLSETASGIDKAIEANPTAPYLGSLGATASGMRKLHTSCDIIAVSS